MNECGLSTISSTACYPIANLDVLMAFSQTLETHICSCQYSSDFTDGVNHVLPRSTTFERPRPLFIFAVLSVRQCFFRFCSFVFVSLFIYY